MYCHSPSLPLACGQKETPPKYEEQTVSPSQQCSSTPVGFGQGFLSKEQCDNTRESPKTWLQLIFTYSL